MKKIEYINNDPQRGIKYDWKAVRKELKALGIPKEFYNPATAPLALDQWFVEMSERTVGKTTGWLLAGLILFEMYGTVTMYIRQVKDMIAPKNSSSLFNVVVENRYIEKITNNKYNNIYYRARKWYLCKVDEETGEILEKCPDYCCRMVSLDESLNLKSSCNEPTGDLVIFDEFISKKYKTASDEFVSLVDVISTIFRLRECGKIVLLANTIDKYSQYLFDLEIFERVAPMDTGDNCTHVTNRGTRIYIEIVGPPKTYRKKKAKWTRLFAGFGKPELASITGEATWAVKCYQHIPEIEREEDTPETLYRNIYIMNNEKLVRLDIMKHPVLGICIYAHWATTTHPDSIIFTTAARFDPRYIYGLPHNNTAGKFINNAIAEQRVYYQANDVGAFIENYILSL